MIYIDNTILAAMSRCTTKGVLRYGLGMTTDEEFVTLQCGSAWHKAMEVYLRGGEDIDVLERFYEQYHDWSLENVPLGNRLEYGNVAQILDQWLADHWLVNAPYEVPGPDFVECGFAYPLDAAGEIMFVGRYDGAVIDKQSGLWYVLDHKTTGWINVEKVNKYQLDSQMSGYIWALQQQVPDRVAGAYINMIELKKLPSDTKRKCKVHGVVYAECGPLHAISQVFMVERTPEQINQWHNTALVLARRYRDIVYASGEYGDVTLEDIPGMPIEGAFNGSCEWCEFSQLCTMGKPVDIMRANLIHKPWEPWHGMADEQA